MERFKNICRALQSTSSKNRKVEILREAMKSMGKDEKKALAYLLLSKIDGYTLGVVKEAIGDFTKYYKGDTYEAVMEHLSKRKYRQKRLIDSHLDIVHVVSSLLNATKDTRSSVLRGIVSILDAETSSFLIASLLKDLQVGVGEGLFLEALAKSEGKRYEDLQNTLYTSGWDALFEDKYAEFKPGMPFRPMLAEKALSFEEIIKEGNFWVEPKLDGVRVLVHKNANGIRIFSRRGKDITSQFPEIVEYASKIDGNFILDGEVIAFKDGKILPFQSIMRRFAERKNVAVDFYFFEIPYFNGDLRDKEYTERREILEKITNKALPRVEIKNADKLKESFEKFIEEGYEGLVCKKGGGRYRVGKRTKEWLKYKRTYEVDAVIVAAEWGHGKRRNWLSDYHLALWKDGKLVEVGKTFKGLTNKEMDELTKILLNLKIGEINGGIIVKPKIVVEVEFEDVQISPKYEKYTLRFARIKRIREDKSPEDAGKIEELERVFKHLHGSF